MSDYRIYRQLELELQLLAVIEATVEWSGPMRITKGSSGMKYNWLITALEVWRELAEERRQETRETMASTESHTLSKHGISNIRDAFANEEWRDDE